MCGNLREQTWGGCVEGITQEGAGKKSSNEEMAAGREVVKIPLRRSSGLALSSQPWDRTACTKIQRPELQALLHYLHAHHVRLGK